MTGTTRGSVFLLGGGLMQMPAIAAARELNLVRHLADGNAHCPGRDVVEHFHHVDLRDLDGLVQVAREIPDLRGVFTAGTDFSRSVAHVSNALGLPGIPVDVALRATDKGVMRAALRDGGVRVPDYVTLPPQADAEISPLPFPVVVKPVDNMGARGVVLVDDAVQFAPAVVDARSASPSGQVIVERYVSGQEYSIDALVYDGTVHITGIAKRHIYFPPFFVELGHTMPAELSVKEETALTAEFSAAVRVLGITRGAAKGDVFLSTDPDGAPVAVVGEIAARLSGGFMSGWTYPYSSGVPLTRLGLEVALGDSPRGDALSPTTEAVAVERALVSVPGTVESVEVGACRDHEVREIFVNCAVGDRVAPPRNNVEKVANVIVASENRSQALRRAEDILDRIVVVLRPDEPETDAFLFDAGWTDRYARYRVTGHQTTEVLAAPVDYRSTLRRWAGASTPLAVAPLPAFGGATEHLEENHISITVQELCNRLETEALIRFDRTAERDRSILFWRVLVAGGRQGVRYLIDSVCRCSAVTHDGSGRREGVLNHDL